MKIKAYRGTKLSEALWYMEWHYPRKYLYWATIKDEARPYAEVEKWSDRSSRGALIEADIHVWKNEITPISIEDWKTFHVKQSKMLQGKVGLLDLWTFQVLITPIHGRYIEMPKIVEVV